MTEANESRFHRRTLLRQGSTHVLALAMAQNWLVSRARGAKDDEVRPLNRFPRMVQEFFVETVRQIEAKRVSTIDQLKTKSDAEAYVASIRARILECFGPFPEKTPLNPKVTGTLDRDGYRIEKLLFESRPGFVVSANLYVPKGRESPMPGVVGTCGHSNNGKAAEAYQAFAQGLARQGYVVLIYDPIGQGERIQYPNEDLTSKVGAGVREHLLAGNQQVLVGEFLGAWRAWDGIRALDYLLTREEVDSKQVGVTGNSGGGTMTTWLCGVESRWSMAAPSCFVTTFRRNLENELPADTEQCPPRALALGLDHEDFIAAMAPKPVILLGKEKDFFDIRGTREAFERLRRLYRLLGVEENLAMFAGPTDHGYSRENREAMYGWFNRVTKVSEGQGEPSLTIETDETLWCTPRGQVCDVGSRPLPSFTAERSKHLRASRPQLTAEGIVKRVADVVKPSRRTQVPDYRILRPLRSRGYPRPHAVPYAVETEPGIHALVYGLFDEPHYSRPPEGSATALLYVSHQSADAELRDEPLIRELIEANTLASVFACDVRGIGESRPDTCGIDTFLDPYGSDYFYAVHSLMLDRPYPAQRTDDLLAVLAWIQSFGHHEVHLAARGWGTIPATFAALLSDTVTKVTLKHAPLSYAEIAEAESYDWPLSSFLPGVLTSFDLPDCYETLKAKSLRQIEPKGPRGII